MAGILGIEYVLPEAVLTNEELAAEFSVWTAGKILKKTGIESRHISADGETAADLGYRAAKKLLNTDIVQRDDIDFVILATQTPDYLLPTSACLIQERLGLGKGVGAFDINLGCSGYIYGLAVSKGLVETGIAQNVLLITAETYSKHINKLDKSTRTIFGDGAAATLIGTGGMQIGDFDLGTDGGGKDLLMIPAGGARLPNSPETSQEHETDGNTRSQDNLFMDGTGVFEFTIREVPGSVDAFLAKAGKTKDDIDLFVFHQANKFMLDFLQTSMDIPKEKFYINMQDIGNTVSASIPIALKRAQEDGTLEGKHNVLLCGFGVGLSWGTTIIYKEDNQRC